MKIKKNIKIELSEGDVKKIIADYLTRDGYTVTKDDVTLSVGTTTEGYGMAEHEVTRFNAAYIDYKEK